MTVFFELFLIKLKYDKRYQAIKKWDQLRSPKNILSSEEIKLASCCYDSWIGDIARKSIAMVGEYWNYGHSGFWGHPKEKFCVFPRD